MKKLSCILLISSISFAGLQADETNDQKALEIRKAQAILKSKTKRTEVVKDDMTNLHEDLVNSGVIDAETINSSKTAGELMNNVTNVRLKKTNEELLKAELGKGEARKAATKEAEKELKEGISELNKIRKLAAVKANKAKLQSTLAETVNSLKNQNEKLKAELKKELAGEKPNQETINKMAEDHEKIADQLKQLTEDVLNAEKKAENAEDKKDLDKVAEALTGEKPKNENKTPEAAQPDSAEKKAEEIAKKIEDKDLADALKKQNELIEKLDKAAKELANDNKKNDEPMTPMEKAAEELAELANEISDQNEQLENIKEEHEGDENLQQDQKFNEALEKQNKLEKAAKAAKEKLKNDPKSKADLEKAEKSLAEAKKELEEGDLKEAMEKNDEAEKSLNEALDKLDKENNKTAKEKNKPKKGNKGKEEEKDPNKKGEKTEPEMEEVNVDFDDTQKAKEGERDIDQVHLRDNKLQLGDMPTAEAVWGNKVGEKDKKVLLQNIREKAPKEYDDLTSLYFEALASIGE